MNWTPEVSVKVARRFCDGWRILRASEVLRRGDETACASLLMSLEVYEGFRPVTPDDEGKTVAEVLAPDADANERVFRRRCG